MRRQNNNGAVQISQLLNGAMELQQDQSVYLEESADRKKHSDDSIITAAIFSAVSSHPKSSFSIWDVNPEGDFTLRYANPQYIKVNKITAEAFGERLGKIFPPKPAKIIHCGLLDCVHRPREVEFIHGLFNRRMFSTRMLPQMDNGKVVRIICYGIDVTEYVHEQNRLKAAGEQFKRQGQMLDTQLKFESLISRALREFMDAGITGFDDCLYNINRELGKAVGVDQSFLFEKRIGGFMIHKAYWSRNETPVYASTSQIQHMQRNGFNLAQLPRVLAINDTHMAKRFPFTIMAGEMNARALLAVPIRRDTRDYGLLCLVQIYKPYVWTTAEISLVKTIADVIMSAYERLHVEAGLQENMRMLTEYDESLQELLTQKETLAAAAQDFLRAGTSRFAECVPHTLRSVGQFLGIDGIRILVRSSKEDADAFSWREDGLPFRFGYDHGSLDAVLRNVVQSLRKPVAFNDMSEAQPLSDLLQAGREEGLRSLLVVPACGEDGLIGLIACYKSVGVKRWHNVDISTAKIFLGIFLDAYRLKAECTDSEAFDVRQHR